MNSFSHFKINNIYLNQITISDKGAAENYTDFRLGKTTYDSAPDTLIYFSTKKNGKNCFKSKWHQILPNLNDINNGRLHKVRKIG